MKLADGISIANRIAAELHGLALKSDLRSRTAAACFAVAQQHQSAILLLLHNQPPMHATAFALLRPLVEATNRGLWLSHCADDEQIRNFVDPQRKQLDAASVMIAIDRAVACGSLGSHKTIYQKHWSALCAYTHTGEHQIQRWMKTENVEPTYSAIEICELISLSTSLAELISCAVKALCSNQSERSKQ